MSPSLDRGEAADAADGQADDSYQKSATGVLQHGDGEVSTLGLAAGWLSVDEAEAGPRHLGDATQALIRSLLSRLGLRLGSVMQCAGRRPSRR